MATTYDSLVGLLLVCSNYCQFVIISVQYMIELLMYKGLGMFNKSNVKYYVAMIFQVFHATEIETTYFLEVYYQVELCKFITSMRYSIAYSYTCTCIIRYKIVH